MGGCFEGSGGRGVCPLMGESEVGRSNNVSTGEKARSVRKHEGKRRGYVVTVLGRERGVGTVLSLKRKKRKGGEKGGSTCISEICSWKGLERERRRRSRVLPA